MKLLKRLGLLLIVALVIAPLATQSIGCRGEVDDDGMDLEVG